MAGERRATRRRRPCAVARALRRGARAGGPVRPRVLRSQSEPRCYCFSHDDRTGGRCASVEGSSLVVCFVDLSGRFGADSPSRHRFSRRARENSQRRQKWRSLLARAQVAYRVALGVRSPQLVVVFLDADRGLVLERVQRRAQEHFMPPELVESQFVALERPTACESPSRRLVVVDAALPTESIVSTLAPLLSS